MGSRTNLTEQNDITGREKYDIPVWHNSTDQPRNARDLPLKVSGAPQDEVNPLDNSMKMPNNHTSVGTLVGNPQHPQEVKPLACLR